MKGWALPVVLLGGAAVLGYFALRDDGAERRAYQEANREGLASQPRRPRTGPGNVLDTFLDIGTVVAAGVATVVGSPAAGAAVGGGITAARKAAS